MSDTVKTKRPELRLARYLREFVLHRTTPVSNIEKYEAVLWFAEIPQEAACRSGAWEEEREPGDAWLEVEKQTFDPIPELPEVVIPWADEQALQRATQEIPPLHTIISVPDEETELAEGETPPMVEQSLADHPEVQAAYEAYRPSWETWSVEHRRREAIQKVYSELFRLRAQLLKQGEVVEAVLGLGLFNWRTETSLIRRHVVAASVELTFDPDKGVIRVEAPEEGAGLRIEDEMLDANLRPDRAHYETVDEKLAEAGDDIWGEQMHTALRAWAQALSPDAQWSPEIKEKTRDASKPSVTFAPALILRKRSQGGMLRVYDALINQLSGDEPEIPKGWGGLVKDDGFGGSDAGETDIGLRRGDAVDRPSPVYFPLPTNREQRQIVEALDRQRGVLVQGPPGTGKSHTIANLICHLLATGQRLLVTAETAQALRVVKEMLPEELQPLCVSFLGQGGGAFAELNRAVQGITTKQASYAHGDEDRRISEIEDELENARRELARTDSELRSIRADETEPHSIADGTYSGTASRIAQRVAGEREQYGWLHLPNGAESEPPLSGEVMTDWLEILRFHSEEQIAKAELRAPSQFDLVTREEFAAAVASEKEEASADAENKELRSHPAYLSLSGLTSDLRRDIAHCLQEIESRRKAGIFERSDWLKTPVRDWIAGKRARWDTIIETSREGLERAEPLCERLGGKVVIIPEGRDPRQVRADAKAAMSHLNGGGKWKTLGLFTPKNLKGRDYLKDEVQVDGAGASESGSLQTVSDFLGIQLALEDLRKTWYGVGTEPLPDDLRQALAVAREQLSALEEGRDYANACNDLAQILATASPPVPAPDWLNGEAAKWLGLIEAAGIEDRYRKATKTVDSAAKALVELRGLHDAHPVVEELAAAVEQRNASAYSECHGELVSIEALLRDQEDRSKTEAVLAEAVPGLADSVTGSIEDPVWSDRFGAWEAAWSWAIADAWLRKRSDIAYHQELQQRRRDTEKRIADLVAHAAALLAWKHFFARLSEKQKAALKGWREAVRAMGKGTGRSARLARLRREARDYMDECRDAIPVWIMPRYLLAEMANPEPECYDLVVVDEASQLGIDSCFLFYISRKMIVVGDDQQISPYGIGIPDDAIADLQRRYLEGIPHHHAFSPQSSLYGNANIRFSGKNIVLREHFRCMPEIIQFSNDLCYAPNGTPLDPLRTYSADRLQPLELRHVPEGYRTGDVRNAQNRPEADAIVEQIAVCIADSRYAGKTMGVISLQGDAQSRLIERKLLERVGPEAIEERSLICGDAYAFQGDERDVVFLSLVAADRDEKGQPQRIGTLAAESDKQRFNVAASRARDQLWLFHTAPRDVLSEKCMRRRLVEYMLHPGRPDIEEGEQIFDSKFEREVYRLITQRGFRVRTQVGVGDTTNHRYRIDLVVEGVQGRLAVECDGDEWHGPDRYDQDMARQRDLERAGWQFVRIPESEFYHDRDKAMEPVWAELERLGISIEGTEKGVEEPPGPLTGEMPGSTKEEVGKLPFDEDAYKKVLPYIQQAWEETKVAGEGMIEFVAAMRDLLVDELGWDPLSVRRMLKHFGENALAQERADEQATASEAEYAGTENTPGRTESAAPASRSVESDLPSKQGVLEFGARGPLAIQTDQPSRKVVDVIHDSTEQYDYETTELSWPEIENLFREYGCPTAFREVMGWYEESWGALMRSRLASTSRFENDEHGEIIIKLRAICLLAMYLGMYQQGGPMEGYFNDHIGLSVYLEELEIDKKVILELLNIDRKVVSETEDVPALGLDELCDIVGKDHLDGLNDLIYDLDDPDSVELQKLVDLVDWEMIEEPVMDLIRDENDAIYNTLENHYGGKNQLFVSIWNSRFSLEEREPYMEILNDFTLGDIISEQKLATWSYVEDGMCDWSI